MPHLSRAACFSSSVMGRVKPNSRSTVNGIVICGPDDARGSSNVGILSAGAVDYESVPVEVEECVELRKFDPPLWHAPYGRIV